MLQKYVFIATSVISFCGYNIQHIQIWEFLQYMKKVRVVHLTELHGGQDSKYLEVPTLKYLVVQKYGLKYQKMKPNTHLIYFL